MVSRRRALQALGSATGLALAGCLSDDGPTDTSTEPGTTAGSGGTRQPSGTPTVADTDRTADDRTDDRPDTPQRTARNVTPAGWSPDWRYQLADPSGENAYLYSIFAGGSDLYALLGNSADPAFVEAIDSAAGEQRWTRSFDARPTGLTATDRAAYLAVGDDNDPEEGWTQVHALDLTDGATDWTFRRDGQALSVVAETDSLALVFGEEIRRRGTHEATPTDHDARESWVHVLDRTSGDHRFAITDEEIHDVQVVGDTIYVAAGRKLVAISVEGSERWRVRADYPGYVIRPADDVVYFLTRIEHREMVVHGVTRDGQRRFRRRLAIQRRATTDGQRLYVGGDAIVALDPDGSEAWRHDRHGTRPLLGPAGETVYYRTGRRANAATAFDAADGTSRWTYTPPTENAWPAFAVGDSVVVDTVGDGVYAVAASDGRPRKHYAGEVDGDPVRVDDTLFVAGDEQVAALSL
jgi:outer membrane protein assembly factor BamB